MTPRGTRDVRLGQLLGRAAPARADGRRGLQQQRHHTFRGSCYGAGGPLATPPPRLSQSTTHPPTHSPHWAAIKLISAGGGTTHRSFVRVRATDRPDPTATRPPPPPSHPATQCLQLGAQLGERVRPEPAACELGLHAPVVWCHVVSYGVIWCHMVSHDSRAWPARTCSSSSSSSSSSGIPHTQLPFVSSR